MRTLLWSVLLLLLLLVAGCGGGKSAPSTTTPTAPAASGSLPSANIWPTVLPQDGVQPWEQADSAGIVRPAGRGVSALSGTASFAAGADSFTTGGVVTTTGEASRLTSSTAGSHALSFATYRMTLGGVQPGEVALDVNLSGPGSSYWVGLSDFGANHWQWRGPFSDNHIRLVKAAGQLDSSNYLSASGNLFVAVAAYDGSSIDVVGVGANPISDGDPIAPPAPAALAATPEPGGLLLEWTPSAAGDLAGYRILWSNASFASATDFGVQSYDYSDGGGRLFLPLPQHFVFVAVQAVDIAGNASPLSQVVNAVPLVGTPPGLGVTVSAPSGLHDTPITLTATGASSYDFDLNGDGVYDVTGDTTGTAQVDTTKTGIIRPGVRGHGADGQAIALGGVSLIITGNTRPAIGVSADVQSGPAPLHVSFTATAQDAEDAPGALTYAWDFAGTGIFAAGTNSASIANDYATPGLFNARVRVTDTQGAWSVASIGINVTQLNLSPSAAYLVTAQQTVLPSKINFLFDGSYSGNGIANFAWDFDGDSVTDYSAATSQALHTYPGNGTFQTSLKVTDFNNLTDTTSRTVYVPSIWSSHYGQPGTCTRQSPVNGTQTNHVAWSYDTGGPNLVTNPVIGPDGSIYIGANNGGLYCIADNGTPTGTVKWTYVAPSMIQGSPALGADGTVYAISQNGILYAVVSDGTSTGKLKWSYNLGGNFSSSPEVGPDGTVYACGAGGMVALVDNGTATPTVKWNYPTVINNYSNPAIGADGTIYVGGFADRTIYALVDNGTPVPTLKWSFLTGGIVSSSVAIGPDGTVYAGSDDMNIYALVDNGTAIPTVKWTYTMAGAMYITTPAVGPDGTVYVATGLGGMLYALKDNGTPAPTLSWSLPVLGGPFQTSPTVDASSTVYFTSNDGNVYALHDNAAPAPQTVWSHAGGMSSSSPIIGPDGTVYVGGGTTLFAFGQ